MRGFFMTFRNRTPFGRFSIPPPPFLLNDIFIDMKIIITEEQFNLLSENKKITSKDVTKHIFNSLSDDQTEDWDFNDYHNVIKDFGKYWELVMLNPNNLEFNEDFDEDTVDEYIDLLDRGIELSPIVIDDENEIIDGNHRAQASLLNGSDIMAYRPISK